MRRLRLSAAAAAVALLAAAACSRGVTPPPPPPSCRDLPRPVVPLALHLGAPPTRARALCIAREYSAVFATAPGWGRLPSIMRAENPNLQLWQERSLLYACDGCTDGVFSTAWIRRNHPTWLIHDTAGLEVHPVGRLDLTLVDFTNLDYQAAWAQRMVSLLSRDGFTGVDVVDGGNDQKWDGLPVVNNEDLRSAVLHGLTLRRQVAKALSLVRSVLRDNGFLVAAENGPPRVLSADQINSTDAVSVGEGFADRTGPSWSTLFRYFQRVYDEHVGSVVWDDRARLSRDQRVFGLASYLLVAIGPASAYGPGTEPTDPLYRLKIGSPEDNAPTRDGAAWMRSYTGGLVVVNPGSQTATVDMGPKGMVSLPPESAAIEVGTRLLQSG
jgi:Hypothetical glycosyl hydrolase family 15